MPINYRSKTFNFFRYQTLLGTISNIGTDQPLFMGHFDPTEAFEDYREEFRFFRNKDNIHRFDNVTKEQMTNWFLEDTDGYKEQIFMPAFYEEKNFICWRWGNPDELKVFVDE